MCDRPHFFRERRGLTYLRNFWELDLTKKLILRGENGNLKIFSAKRENFFQKIVLFSEIYLIKIWKAKISHFFCIWRIPPNQIFHAQTKQNLATLAEFRHFWSHWRESLDSKKFFRRDEKANRAKKCEISEIYKLR